MNQINTAILRLVTGNDELSITVTMHPFPSECLRGFGARLHSSLSPYVAYFLGMRRVLLDAQGWCRGPEMLSGWDDRFERSQLLC